MTSNSAKRRSELGIGLFIRFARPLRKSGERIVSFGGRLIDHDSVVGQTVTERIARLMPTLSRTSRGSTVWHFVETLEKIGT